MRTFCIGWATVMIVVLAIAGCGNSDGGAAFETTAAKTPSTSTTAATSITPMTAATSTTKATPATSTTTAAKTSTTKAPAGDAWTSVATLHSNDPFWKDMKGILVSEPFTATGEVRVVLDMPDAGDLDGVIAAIIPADKATDMTALIAAIGDGVVVTMIPSAPTKVVSGLDGTYVLFNSVPTSKAWSLDVQTRR